MLVNTVSKTEDNRDGSSIFPGASSLPTTGFLTSPWACLRYTILFSLLTLAFITAPSLHARSYDCAVLNVPGIATSINNAGVIVGSGGGHGFIRDTTGNVTIVDFPGQTNTQLFAINNHGVITGQWGNPYPYPGASGTGFFTVDLAGNIKTITPPPPIAPLAFSIYGINDDGAVLISSSTSLFVLQSDGTVSASAPLLANFLSGSLNNSYQFLASRSLFSFWSSSELAGPDGTLTPIEWIRPGGYGPTTALGLNNAGVVVGFIGRYPKGPPFGPPWSGFVRDASGNFSALDCAGLENIQPNAINDNGVIVGSSSSGSFIATPIPGNPQFQVSVSSINFPPMYPGVSAPANFTVTNTGDSRLDLGGPRLPTPPSGPFLFEVSPCTVEGAPVASLNPGESCIASASAGPILGSGVFNSTVFFEDSSPGSPHSFPVAVTILPFPPPGPPPSCEVVNIVTVPPRQANFTMQDIHSGLASIVPLFSTNVAVSVPSFTPGTTDAVSVTATQIDPTQPSQVGFMVSNTSHGPSGYSTCDASLAGSSQWTGRGGTFTSRIAVAVNNDGLEDTFVRGTDNALWHIGRTAEGSAWSAWQSFGGVLASNPVVGQNADGRLEVFVLGSDNSLWHLAQTDPGAAWSGNWEGLGGVLISDPMVVTNEDGRLEVFAVGTDQALWHITQTSAGGDWSDWSSLRGGIVSNPATVVNADGRLEVFVLGMDQALWHIFQTAAGGSWSPWENLGGHLTGDPTPVVNQDGRLEVFARGTDAQLWHIAQTSPGETWSTWDSLGGVVTSNPAVAVNGNGRLEAFVRGTDNALWHIAQTAPGEAWSNWATLGGWLDDKIATVLTSDGRVEVFAASGDDSLWYIAQGASGLWN